MVIAFGPFEMDLGACELRRQGRAVTLQPRVFDTLRYLIEHRHRVVSRQELLDALWRGQQLSRVAVVWSISHARKALGQRANQNTYIQTFRRRGYRFVAQVRTADEVGTPARRQPSNADLGSFGSRAGPLQKLTAALDDALSARGSLIVLRGEAGIGKTRLMGELAERAQQRGVSAWVARCVQDGAGPPFWPFIEILRAACAEMQRVDAAHRDAVQLLQDLESRAPGSFSVAAGSQAFWLSDRLTRVLVAAAGDSPRLIVIDDLHGADACSLRALALLSPRLARLRLLVVVALRADDGLDGAAVDPGILARLRPATLVTLPPLDVEHVMTYLHELLGDPPSLELARAVHTRTAGNPWFVREVVQAALDRCQGGTQLSVADIMLPMSARTLVNPRLTALSDRSRQLLAAASVIGVEGSISLLQSTCGFETREFLDSLHRVIKARIIEPDCSVQYRFVHPLLRELTYDEVPIATRAELHARVGLALEATLPTDRELPRLAFHFRRAIGKEYAERAERYAQQAGDAAMRLHAYDEAAVLYANALQTAPAEESDPSVASRGALLLKHAAALVRAGQHDAGRARCEQALALARSARQPELLVEAAGMLRGAATAAHVPDPAVLAALQQALAELPETATRARARACLQLACIPPYASRIAESTRLCDEGSELARASGDRSLELEAMRARLHALSGPDSTGALLTLTDQLLAGAAGLLPALVTAAHLARYFAFLRLGQVIAADHELAAFGRMGQAHGMREWTWQHRRLLVHRMLNAGSVDEAQRQFAQLWTEGRALQLRYADVVYAAQAHEVREFVVGRRVPPALHDEQVWEWARAIPAFRAWQLLRTIEHGNRLEARRELAELVEDGCAAITKDSAYLYTLAELAVAAIALREREAARTLESVLEPYADRIAVSDFALSHGSLHHHLGMLARLLGEGTRARERFEAARRVNASTGHQLLALRSGLCLAEVVLERSPQGSDRATAAAIALEVDATAERYGAPALQAAARQLMDRYQRSTPHTRGDSVA